MLQVNAILQNKDKVITGLKKKFFENPEEAIDQVIALDQQRKDNQAMLDETLSESNKISKSIGMLMKEGKKDEANEAKAKTGELKARSKELGEKQNEIESALKDLLVRIPNVPHASVPEGKTDEDNEVLYTVDTLPDTPEGAKPHWDLIEEYDIVDFKTGIKVTGAGFPFYKRAGAKLNRALISYFLDKASEAGYDEVIAPLMINEDSGFGTGQLPDKDGQMYHVNAENFYLIPTAEVPITNMFRGDIIKAEDLPLKYCGHTPCFRREAGSWGAHVRGLNRLHQFDKVEIVQVTKPVDSYNVLEEMKNHVEALIKDLELPYRILRLCGGDVSFASALTFDFEVYSAAQEKWLEVSSVSNFETFQANRLKLRYKNEEGKSELLHTLNGSALALPRIMAAILENNQTEEGIKVPNVLIPYMGMEMITK